MSKYIDADHLKKAVEHELDMQDLYLPVHFFEVVDGMEAADVQEVKHGRWIKREYCSNYSGYDYGMKCSVCGKPLYRQLSEKMPNYCPNCGAKMDEVEE